MSRITPLFISLSLAAAFLTTGCATTHNDMQTTLRAEQVPSRAGFVRVSCPQGDIRYFRSSDRVSTVDVCTNKHAGITAQAMEQLASNDEL